MNEIVELVSKIGIPSAIISILLIVSKFSPITLLTSSSIERKILSKEKRVSIKILNYIISGVLIAIIYLIITVFFFRKGELYNDWIVNISLSVFISMLLFLLIYNGVYRKNIKDLLGVGNKKSKIVIFICFIFIIFISYLIPPYTFGTLLFSVVNETELNLKQYIVLISMMFGIYILSALFFIIPFTRLLIIFCDFNDNENEVFYFTEDTLIDGTIKWYIFYSINSKLVYCGNKHTINQSDHFIFVSIDELYKKVLIKHVA